MIFAKYLLKTIISNGIKMEIGIIVNPHAKKNVKRSPVNAFRAIGGGYADVRVTDTLDEVVSTAKDFRKQGIKYLGISGGDGSVHHVQSVFMNVYRREKIPPILILRSGTMNTISRTINLKGTGPEIMERFINKIRSGVKPEIHYRDTVKVNDKCCYMFGIGLAANYISQYNQGKNKGPIKAVYVLMRGVYGGLTGREDISLFKRVNAKVIIDGKKLWFDDIFAVFIATIEEIGISFKPMSRAYEKENTFHTIAAGMTPAELIPRLFKLRAGIPLDHPNHYDNIAKEVIIKGPKRYDYMMDGDIYEWSGELKVVTGPRIGMVYV